MLMEKCVSSIYEYNDYRVLLLDDFTKRSTLNSSYSLRAYARDLKLSPGYLSSVLRGRKNLNLQNYKNVFSKIGFPEKKDLEYVEKLIIYKTADHPLIRDEALTYIHKHYRSLELKDLSARDGFLNSEKHLITYMVINILSEIESIKRIVISFGLSENDFSVITEELIATGYIKKEENSLFVINKKIAITSSPKILDCSIKLSELLFSNMKEKNGISFPLKSTHSLIMGFDEDSFHQAIEVYKQFLHQIYRISQNTKKVDRITIFTDILTTSIL